MRLTVSESSREDARAEAGSFPLGSLGLGLGIEFLCLSSPHVVTLVLLSLEITP